MLEHSVDAFSPAQLLDEYTVGSPLFLATPKRTLLAQGEFAKLSYQGKNQESGDLSEHVTSLLNDVKKDGHAADVVVGAIPFDLADSAQLVVPESISAAGPLRFDSSARIERSLPETDITRMDPEPEEYANGVENVLARIKAGEIRKAVLGRTLHLRSRYPVDIHQLLRNLISHNRADYTFALNLPGKRDSEKRTLIGSSPELLIRKSGGQITANPLAGSLPRIGDPEADRHSGALLLSSAKDRHEHAVVVEAVAKALRPFCKKLDVPSVPSLMHTETMWHLSSLIKGELADPSTSALSLALAMHPTPAVCGSPTEPARSAIYDNEPFKREFFTGLTGWCAANGDGEWVISIRCAEVEKDSLRLFAGAGIVDGSNPDNELSETAAKFRTMLLAMGL